MILYPTIELQQGRCVSLRRGRIEDAMLWHVDPLETARGFVSEGAQWLHVTDFDGVDGGTGNGALLRDLIRAVGIPVQLGGGFRTIDAVARWIDAGAARIVISSLAVHDPEAVRRLTRLYPDQIVLSVDVWRGQVMADGWRRPSAFAPRDFIAAFAECPLASVIVTDIDVDLEEMDGQLGLISGLADATRAPLIASGVVRSLDDIARLKFVPGIAGALVGRALFQKNFDLREALGVAGEPTPVADFR